MDIDEVEFVTTATGYSILSGAMTSNTGFLFVSLTDWAERDLTAMELVNKANQILAGTIKDADVFTWETTAAPATGFESHKNETKKISPGTTEKKKIK